MASNEQQKDDMDVELYSKYMDKLIDLAWDEYAQETFNRFQAQHIILRNYLWLGTVIFSAECAVFSQMETGAVWLGFTVSAGMAFKVLALLAMLCSFMAVLFGVDSMRGDTKVAMPFYGKDTIAFAWTAWAEAHKDAGQTTMQRDILECLNKTISHNRERARRKGTRLRCMSYLLQGSLLLGLCSAACAIF